MEKKEIILEFIEYNSADELTGDENELIATAKSSAKNAYAPYSHFKVGAAVLLSNGKIIAANNQENAAYPSGLCAERIAIFSAVAQNPDVAIKTIAISADTNNYPVTPCGACRQVIAEYETKFNNKIKIIMTGASGKVISTDSVKNLLPMMFNSSSLNK